MGSVPLVWPFIGSGRDGMGWWGIGRASAIKGNSSGRNGWKWTWSVEVLVVPSWMSFFDRDLAGDSEIGREKRPAYRSGWECGRGAGWNSEKCRKKAA
jgi:hypothetical protein